MTISPAKKRRILERDGWRCRMPRCFAPGEGDSRREIDPDLYGTREPWSPTVDHIVPKAAGGTDRDENLRAAHRWCNTHHGTLADAGRPSRLREVPDARVPALAQLGGTDIASRIGASAAAALAALASRRLLP